MGEGTRHGPAVEPPNLALSPGRRVGRRPGPPLVARPARASASSLVENELRQAIIAMRLKPGEALNEKEIAARFGLSRTPVREAMLRLKDDELIEIFPQSGTFVARIPIGKIPEAVVIRQALEAMAAEQAARRRDETMFRRLREIIGEQERAAREADPGRFHEADEAFHALISDAAGFPGIWRMAQTVKAQVDRCRRLTLPVPGRMARVILEHQRILGAIMDGDEAGARQALTRHLETVLPDLEELRRENPDYFV
ncbi:MAG: GntR family transcriptional regulator [Methylobacterium sp.]|uniref:GntR family transcriptional regulator n=1 Tax=Rhabdaerophilum sp. TaxID=2717341 RepID=UPI002A19F714|nr:GntR family transcriptional regulator [Methylobacterium sp.]MCA3656144.1 GntR family transcriptional regulator [Methylobacterium sp.]MCA3657105.1 GntR family transcriptional regulator [Methylobacterium sp.]MCA3663837.1 GntR family transcriptional regulator [Methylobacterium sp.]MCA3667898.1 GntR family transcriptional regulator [Methylobacterium sp.]